MIQGQHQFVSFFTIKIKADVGEAPYGEVSPAKFITTSEPDADQKKNNSKNSRQRKY